MQDQTSALEAMATPCDLWILPTPRNSRWFTHLDWYLNWQMCKGLAYGGLHLPPETYRVAEEYGVSVTDRDTAGEAPLLLSVEGRIPAYRCLVIDYDEGLRAWLDQAGRLAKGLQAREVRVFLPTGHRPSEAKKSWKTTGIDVQFLPDLEANP